MTNHTGRQSLRAALADELEGANVQRVMKTRFWHPPTARHDGPCNVVELRPRGVSTPDRLAGQPASARV